MSRLAFPKRLYWLLSEARGDEEPYFCINPDKNIDYDLYYISNEFPNHSSICPSPHESYRMSKCYSCLHVRLVVLVDCSEFYTLCNHLANHVLYQRTKGHK